MGAPGHVIEMLGLRPRATSVLKDIPLQKASWLMEMPGGERVVLRRYHDRATLADLTYEHAVLRYLASAGWVVPEPVGELIESQGLWYCLTRYVPGRAIAAAHGSGRRHDETPRQQRRRGRDLARLDLALRSLGDRVGQRPGWRAQHSGTTVISDIDFDACLRALSQVSPGLSSWFGAAAAQTRDALVALGADELPVTVVHGDFAAWNVRYKYGRLAGVIDFGLTHLDSRPYELAIARTYRSPQTVSAYRSELARDGWPLSELEEAAICPVYCAFRVDQAAWAAEDGRRTGDYELAMIERQLSRTGTVPP